jgi:hypothetical protein
VRRRSLKVVYCSRTASNHCSNHCIGCFDGFMVACAHLAMSFIGEQTWICTLFHAGPCRLHVALRCSDTCEQTGSAQYSGQRSAQRTSRIVLPWKSWQAQCCSQIGASWARGVLPRNSCPEDLHGFVIQACQCKLPAHGLHPCGAGFSRRSHQSVCRQACLSCTPKEVPVVRKSLRSDVSAGSVSHFVRIASAITSSSKP